MIFLQALALALHRFQTILTMVIRILLPQTKSYLHINGKRRKTQERQLLGMDDTMSKQIIFLQDMHRKRKTCADHYLHFVPELVDPYEEPQLQAWQNCS